MQHATCDRAADNAQPRRPCSAASSVRCTRWWQRVCAAAPHPPMRTPRHAKPRKSRCRCGRGRAQSRRRCDNAMHHPLPPCRACRGGVVRTRWCACDGDGRFAISGNGRFNRVVGRAATLRQLFITLPAHMHVRPARLRPRLPRTAQQLTTPATSAPGPGPPLPHLHRDRACPCHICAGTGLAPATSAPGPGLPWTTSGRCAFAVAAHSASDVVAPQSVLAHGSSNHQVPPPPGGAPPAP